MDVQGAEVSVLEGAVQFLNSKKEMILVTEFWPTGLAGMGSSKEKFAQILKELGFTKILLMDEEKGKLENVDDICSLIPSYSNKFVNLICIKGA